MSRSLSRSRARGYDSSLESLDLPYSKKFNTPPRSSRADILGTPRQYDDRNPLSEGRFSARSSPSVRRDRFEEDDSGAASVGSTREFLSRLREGPATASSSKRGMFSEPRHTGRSTISQSSPRFRRDDYDEGVYTSGSKYEVIGMKEELKQKEAEVSHLLRDMETLREQQMSRTRQLEDELDETLASRRDLETRMDGEIHSIQRSKNEEIGKLKQSYEEEMADMRAKLVDTFKDDMEEMKSEWETAFRRLQQESDAAKSAIHKELSDANEAKAEMESKISKLNADFRSQLEAEKQRAEQLIDDLKRSKEEDLDRLREMYEDHIDGMKNKAAAVEASLKDELQMILEENEKVKMCYDNLEEEMTRAKHELNEINEQYQDALDDNAHYKKDAKKYKEEADKLMDENEKMRRDLSSTKDNLDRIKNSYERTNAEKGQIKKELDKISKEKVEVGSSYDDVAKKLAGLEEERVLESRYTEALVKQRDNMNEIIESGQEEIKELKAKLDDIMSYQRVAEQFNHPNAEAVREEFAKSAKMRERFESLGRERERYNSTIKALKVDLKALHKGNLGPESSLQEHMRLLSETWEKQISAAKETKNLKAELEESIQLLEANTKEKDQMVVKHKSEIADLEKKLKDTKRANQETERQELESLRSSLSKTEAIRDGLKKKLEKAYFDLEEAQLEITAIKRTQEKELDSLQAKLTKQHDRIIESQEEEILSLKEMLQKARKDRTMDLEIAKSEIAESFKTQLRLTENKHSEMEVRAKEQLEQKYRDEMNELRSRTKELERTLKEQKDALDQKSMMEIKRRGEFAKQKQEVEILRSKERHLEAHVAQLEQMQAKTVEEYEQRIASGSICTNNSLEKSLKKHVKELEKKLEVSSAAMKQLGKSSLLMEKENQRLMKDKNDLKLQLQKLVDCAEKLEGKK